MSLSVFPACAGVILHMRSVLEKGVSVPRMRGGDPTYLMGFVSGIRCSPHARG